MGRPPCKEALNILKIRLSGHLHFSPQTADQTETAPTVQRFNGST
jgi:hypothetical protein